MHPEVKENSEKIMDYFANEFGKADIKDDSDYLVSAIFADICVSHGVDGILYPSIWVEGRGFNIALKPESVEQKMRLIAAGECIIYKYFDKSVMDNLTSGSIDGANLEIQYQKVQNKDHAGEEACLKELGISSISDLK